MVIFTNNTQEVRNELRRKGLKVGSFCHMDEVLIIEKDQYYSIPYHLVEKAAKAYREDGEVVRDMTRNCCLGNISDLL